MIYCVIQNFHKECVIKKKPKNTQKLVYEPSKAQGLTGVSMKS